MKDHISDPLLKTFPSHNFLHFHICSSGSLPWLPFDLKAIQSKKGNEKVGTEKRALDPYAHVRALQLHTKAIFQTGGHQPFSFSSFIFWQLLSFGLAALYITSAKTCPWVIKPRPKNIVKAAAGPRTEDLKLSFQQTWQTWVWQLFQPSQLWTLGQVTCLIWVLAPTSE